MLVDSSPPQKELKTYALHDSVNSADISPDEQLVVTERTKKAYADSTTNIFSEVIQTWNFKEDKLVAEFTAQRVDVKASSTGHFFDPVRGQRIVRFSTDGKVVALIDRKIHVLRAADLSEIRTIPLVEPGGVIHEKTTVNTAYVGVAEVSPSGDAVAILWAKGRLHGRIELYDLSTGRNTLSWDTPQGFIFGNLVWHPSGKLLLIAIPNEMPCRPPGNQPDVFAFDVQTGAVKYKFRTGLLTESIAVTADNRVLAVDSYCLEDRDPKLRVFDLLTGKHLLDVSGRGTGVRCYVSASTDGSRFLAFTGKIKRKFDWGDFVFVTGLADMTFSVWNLTNYEGIVTSQNLKRFRLNTSELRLSSKGRYALALGYGGASAVYELP